MFRLLDYAKVAYLNFPVENEQNRVKYDKWLMAEFLDKTDQNFAESGIAFILIQG